MPGAGLCNWVVGAKSRWRRGGFRFPETALFQPARPGGRGVRIFIITLGEPLFVPKMLCRLIRFGLHKP